MRKRMLFKLCGIALLSTASGQCVDGMRGAETGPSITLRKCTSPGSCKKEPKKLTIDANWRWVHENNKDENCYKGNEWIVDQCKGDKGKECAQHCCIGGNDMAKYEKTYGVTEIPDGVQMKFVNVGEYTWGTTNSVGARLYMLNNDKYEMFKVMNAEFAFDADMSQLECGMNGAIYFVEMFEDGGSSKYPANKAGAKLGTGYCDAQCPHDMKFINGEANVKGWRPNEKDFSGNMGTGHYGACCNEMDIWEANARSQAYTPHPCTINGKTMPGNYKCEGTECGDNDKDERYKGVCDKDGCDYANWRMGSQKAYGKGSQFEVNTEKPFTQVTQFITHNGKDDGDLAEIRRYWRQDGNVIKNAEAKHLIDVEDKSARRRSNTKFTCKGAETNSLSDDICESQNERFGDQNHYKTHGGTKEMGESLKRGHVLAISLWDDVEVSMMWLDACWPRWQNGNPVDHPFEPEMKSPADCPQPGVSRGPCNGGKSSRPEAVRGKHPEAVVKYWNFAVGCLGCTTEGVPKGEPARKPIKNAPKCPYGGGKEAPPSPPSDGRRRGSPPPAPPPSDGRRRSPAPPPSDGRRRKGAPPPTPPPTRRRSPKRRRRKGSPPTRRRKGSTRRRSSKRRRR